ncbi:hypothetical protein G6F37_004482 [Rhizopus arrhizus]|nr:hypothetical protein G6F38_004634 [Rhizopus arrhizus]KAG1159895.1 hypothetical protein G6F37_004482 [Rhizopus arrhizus]
MLTCIQTLALVLEKSGLEVTKIITNAKVPIAKVWDPKLKLACDFNINNTLALQNTKMIKTYVAIDPRVRPLILFIKHWARHRNIDDAADGGTISTYTWICMVIHFLQTRQPPILPNLHGIPHSLSPDNLVIHGHNTSFCDDLTKLQEFGRANRETLGGLLYAFFRKFGFEFDYRQQVISIRSGRILTRKEKGWDQGLEGQQLLCVEEPFDVQRNLGNSANEEAVKGLILEFQRAVHVILETKGNLKNVSNWLIFAWNRISRANKAILIMSLLLVMIQIIATIIVLAIGNSNKIETPRCAEPLELYLIIYVIRVGLSLPLIIYQHLSRRQPSDQQQSSNLMSGWAYRFKSLLDLFAILWFIVVAMRAFNINVSTLAEGGSKEDLAKIPVFIYKTISEVDTPSSSSTTENTKLKRKPSFTRRWMKRRQSTTTKEEQEPSKIDNLTISRSEDAVCSICLSEYENNDLLCKLWQV